MSEAAARNARVHGHIPSYPRTAVHPERGPELGDFGGLTAGDAYAAALAKMPLR